MTKSTEKVNKTTKIEMRATDELKAMAQNKAKRQGLRMDKKLSVSAWIEWLIRKAR